MSGDRWDLALAGAPIEEQRSVVEGALRGRGLSEGAVGAISDALAAGAVLRPVDDGASRAGGGEPPLVPPGWEWPQTPWGRLAFLGAVRLDGIVGIDGLGLPVQTGTLLFFHDETPGLDDFLLESSHVLHVPAGATTVSAPGSGEFQVDEVAPLAGAAMPLLAVDDDMVLELAELYGSEISSSLAAVMQYQANAWRFLGGEDLRAPLSQWIRLWFQTPESDEDHEHFSPAERDGQGWRCLLQLTGLTDRSTGHRVVDMDWAAGGSLTFCIPETDLAAWRFDRVISFVST